MFKQFYEHFDNDISEIQEHSEVDNIENNPHQFPKKYLKGKAFKKMNNTMNSSEWLSSRSLWSEHKEEHHYENNITRDQSLKENLRIESKMFLLDSAKMVQSFVDIKTSSTIK